MLFNALFYFSLGLWCVCLGVTFYFSCLEKNIYSEFLLLDFLRKFSCLYLPEEGDPVFSVVTQNQNEPRNAAESTNRGAFTPES